MRVLTALGASVSSHLFHKLVHERIFIVLLDHASHSILEEIDLQFAVRVHLIVHVQFL